MHLYSAVPFIAGSAVKSPEKAHDAVTPACLSAVRAASDFFTFHLGKVPLRVKKR
jgi:hypothetical protein